MSWHFAIAAPAALTISVPASDRGDLGETACLSLTERITNIRRLEHHLSLETNLERSCASTCWLRHSGSDAARSPRRSRSPRSLGRRAYPRLRT